MGPRILLSFSAKNRKMVLAGTEGREADAGLAQVLMEPQVDLMLDVQMPAEILRLHHVRGLEARIPVGEAVR